MNNMCLKYHLALLLYLFLLSGCGLLVSYIDTNKSNNELNVSQTTIKEFKIQIKQNNQTNARLFNKMSEFGVTESLKPYPELKKLHQAMLEIESQYQRESFKSDLIASKYRNSIAGKANISEDSPAWPRILGLHERYRAAVDKLKVLGSDYQTKAELFLTKAKDNGIYVVPRAKLEAYRQEYITLLNQRGPQIEDFILKNNNKIGAKMQQSLSNNQSQNLNKIKQQLKNFTLYVQGLKKHSSELLSQIAHDFKARDKIWTTENTKLHLIVVSMTEHFNAVAQKIKSIEESWDTL